MSDFYVSDVYAYFRVYTDRHYKTKGGIKKKVTIFNLAMWLWVTSCVFIRLTDIH